MSDTSTGPGPHAPSLLDADGQLNSRIRFEHRGAQVDITGVLLHNDRALFTATVQPTTGTAWTDFWVAEAAGINPLPEAMVEARARMSRLVDFLPPIPEPLDR
jgi:hypothetical protein